jgi:hypothetical protein
MFDELTEPIVESKTNGGSMKFFIGTTLLLLLAGAPAFAGQEPDKDKPKEEPRKQEEPKKAPKPAEKPKPEPARQQQENKDRAKQEEERKAPPPKPAQHPDNRAQDQQRAKQTEQHTDRNAHPEQHRNARRIPDEKFRASFGREHHFHVERRDDRRFNYGGFWFVYDEPWPGDWDYNDDVYVDYIDDEYYLINPRRPGVRLLVIVND